MPVEIYSTVSGRGSSIIERPEGYEIAPVTIFGGGTLLDIAGAGQRIIFDVASGERIAVGPNVGAVKEPEWIPGLPVADGRKATFCQAADWVAVASCPEDGSLHLLVWDIESWRVKGERRLDPHSQNRQGRPPHVPAIAFDPTGQHLAVTHG